LSKLSVEMKSEMDRIVHQLRKNVLHFETLVDSAGSIVNQNNTSFGLESDDDIQLAKEIWTSLGSVHCSIEELVVSVIELLLLITVYIIYRVYLISCA